MRTHLRISQSFIVVIIFIKYHIIIIVIVLKFEIKLYTYLFSNHLKRSQSNNILYIKTNICSYWNVPILLKYKLQMAIKGSVHFIYIDIFFRKELVFVEKKFLFCISTISTISIFNMIKCYCKIESDKMSNKLYV